jgi:hypothetical protein
MSEARDSRAFAAHEVSASPGREVALSVIALLAGVTPILMTLLGPGIVMMRSNPGASPLDLLQKTATMAPSKQQMMAMMAQIHDITLPYVLAVMLPALVVLAVIAVYARRHHRRLHNRIVWGLGAGGIASFGLDLIREPGTLLGAFPSDMPQVFGQMITGQAGAATLLVGYVYHFLNGATFGLMFALLFGWTRWYWGIAWALLFELGMMLSPPVMMTAGAFGVRGFWPELFLVSLLAHIVFGAVLGVLIQKKITHRGWLLNVARPRTG